MHQRTNQNNLLRVISERFSLLNDKVCTTAQKMMQVRLREIERGSVVNT